MKAQIQAACALVLVLILNPGQDVWAAPLDADAVQRVIALDRQVDTPQAAKRAAIRAAFDDLRSSYAGQLDDVSTASPDELNNLWRLAGFMAYATHEPAFARAMLQVSDEYARRNLVAPLELRVRLLTTWISLREFDQARTYSASAASAGVPLEYLPAVEGPADKASGRLGVLRVDTQRGVLRRETLKLDDEVQVFVVSFIGCAFSRRAAYAIEHHPVLSRFMRERSTWIVEPDLLHFNDVRAWNQSHPSTAFAYVDRMEPWGFIDDWSTPTFYFVRRGQVLSKVQGWPSDAEGIAALLTAMGVSRDEAGSGSRP